MPESWYSGAENMEENTSIAALGGKARAEKLTKEERSAIASVAAEARWAKAADPNKPRIPKATHESDTLKLGNMTIACAVLENGTRVLSERGVTKALGGKRGGSHWRRMKQDGATTLPVYLSAENLRPYINTSLDAALAAPILYKTKSGALAHGLPATLLPEVCDVFLKARDKGELHRSQADIAKQADILMRALAHVGIIALVDEATGYQDVRDRLALQEILKKYITGKLFEWVKTFPLEFYKEIFRLRGWKWNNGRMPSSVGHYTNDLVYSRLAPLVLSELKKLNPPNEKGYREHRHHQLLTRDIGHPALSRHLYQLIGMMNACESWEQFYKAMERKLPKFSETPLLPFDEAI